MKDIKAILSEYEIPQETAAAIAEQVRANYRTVAEWTKKVDRIAELEKANAEMSEAAAKLDGSVEEIEALKAQVETYKTAEAERKAAEALAQKKAEFRKAFDEALGDKRFANSIVEEAVFEKAYAHCTTNAGASAKDAVELAVEGVDNVWVNPQHDPKSMPGDDQLNTGRKSAEHQRKTFADALFGGK